MALYNTTLRNMIAARVRSDGSIDDSADVSPSDAGECFNESAVCRYA